MEGPNGLGYAKNLTESLVKLGLNMRRFKTGTPARIHRDSIDFSVMTIQEGDEKITHQLEYTEIVLIFQ